MRKGIDAGLQERSTGTTLYIPDISRVQIMIGPPCLIFDDIFLTVVAVRAYTEKTALVALVTVADAPSGLVNNI